ncbi:hypothetical protein F53441_5515 [Fusarium austroafricanum]|uniref:Zn(2)-C6 fungal-type domain-containing protein n=1 Tax=Fusarium austroafricanum TaxID=2364996 RepID=A0A8H4KJQ0_9HYPO|nr:hypothetical protein F53441_5515 [Fusarium austroafricanum]
METVMQSSRRKACDYCVSRKTRCDGRKPCSNCTLYAAACKTTITTRRKATPRNGGVTPASSTPPQPDRIAALEERLAGIEALLTALVTSGPAAPETQADISRSNIGVSEPSTDWNMSPASMPLGMINCQPAALADIPPTVQVATSTPLELAPLSEVLPVVDSYFRNYNTIIPLFDETAFMRMLLDWYSSPTKRSMIPWAAINVVLGINYRVLDGRPADNPEYAQCLQNVRSVMSELMTLGCDLIGFQVLLGMVILFQGSPEFQLAIVLTGSLVRLAQSLRLNSKQAQMDLSKTEKEHRRRLFWLSYIYDREMAQRSRCPYQQPDSETDIDLPEAVPEDNLGVISSSTDHIRFNYLRSCAQLAYIQGKAHDLLYSQKAQKLTQEQKTNSITRIEELLSEWMNEIPVELRTADGMEKRLSPITKDMMMSLWARHLETRIKIQSIFTFDDTWFNRVRLYLSPAVIGISDDVDGEVRRADLTPLPSAWAECVGYSRVCLELLISRQLTEYRIWLQTCTSLPCIILLIVNMIEFPDHNLVTQDRKLLDSVFGIVEEMRDEPYEETGFQMSPSTAWALLDDIEFQ